MARFALFVVRHRRLVMLVWLIVFAASLAGAGHLAGRLTRQFSLRGQPGYETNQRILRIYGTGGPSAPLVPVIKLPAGTTVDTPGLRAELARAFGAVAQHCSTRQVVSFASTGNRGFVAADGRTTFGLVFTRGQNGLGDDQSATAKAITPLIAAAVPGAHVTVTGLPVPFLRSLGYGGILIPLVSVAVSLTLLPAGLAAIGPRADWPRRRQSERMSRAWARWAAFVIRHRIAAALAALAMLGTLCAAAAGIRVGDPQAASLAHGGTA